MSITVTQDIKERMFPIRIVIDQQIDQKFSINAAIELRNKLESAISDYQVAKAIEGGE